MSETAPAYPFRTPAPLEPPPEWAELRGRRPVAPVRLPSGDTALLLTRYDDVRAVLSDPRFTRQLDSGDAARVTANEDGGIFGSGRAGLSSRAGDAHKRWRRMVGTAFTVKRVAAMRPRIEEMAGRLIDAVVADGPPADLVAALGFPLPVWVICDLLGVPDADRDRFAYWSDTMLSMTRYAQEEIDAAQAEFTAYMSAHIAAKRANPGDDLLSELIGILGAGDDRTSRLLLGTGQGLLVAGHETTANMVGKMVAMLLADRTRWTALLADPALVRPAVEEALRFDANPGFGMPRYLSEPVEVAGEALPAGTTVVCSLAAANRDEDTFPAAETMDLCRTPNPHLAFGAGPHACVGQALARTELQAVLDVLVRRLPGLTLDVPPEELPVREGLVVGGLRRVPVRW